MREWLYAVLHWPGHTLGYYLCSCYLSFHCLPPPQPQALHTKKPSSLIPTPSSLHTYNVGIFTLYLLVTFH